MHTPGTHVMNAQSTPDATPDAQKVGALISFMAGKGLTVSLDDAAKIIELFDQFDAKRALGEAPEEVAAEPQDWEVSLCRISYGHKTVTIKGAASKEEAEARALDEAGNHEFSEKSSDYAVNGSTPAST